ncbi:aldehyde-activating protein [Maritimibacter sp. 55A14]|uniref:GFA family protein n=1 Tax=Maritimibacter sp. 55A14 TaxID=2174844 RepID=UPI000D60F211|nr:GFA family protein [Maritimibacter sp. 55A14]PWE29321.1 aldehyde-activating protein [Maritimibacter sp. 55A14]
MQKGSCLCGAVAFSLEAEPDAPLVCHCKQCRQWTGHVFSATGVPLEALRFSRDETLTWYRASPVATRGFCRVCGSSLFWKADTGGRVNVAMGSLEAPTGLRLARHVWVDFKGDYYEIADGLPQETGEGKPC